MKPYLYELHIHTSEGSRCARCSAREQVRHYHSLGFTGICITDHFLNGNTTVPKNLPWEERVRLYCRGYELAREEGGICGMDVFFGWEYTYSHGNDFLTLGLSPEWLLGHPEIMEMSLNDYCDYVRAAGAIVIHAHPFREAAYIDMIRLTPRHVDAVETDNAGRPDFENGMARHFCEAYGLAPTSGTDNHRGAVPRYAVLGSDVRFPDLHALMAAILSRSMEQISIPGNL